MSDEPRPISEELLALVGSALDDLRSGNLDADLLDAAPDATDRERELVGRLRELLVSRRRAARKLGDIAAAIDSGLRDFRDRVSVAATVNTEVTSAACAADASATSLKDFARGVRAQAIELHALIDSVAEATASLAESGREATVHSDTLSGAVSDVAASTSAIATSMTDIDRAIGDLMGDVTTTSSAVTAINSSIRSIDAGASETSSLSSQLSEAAANGIEVVRQTAEAVASVNTSIGGVADSMDHLVARSEEVTEITKIIQAIAVQAKLLALNASIQAAHAGEAGRGFSVVAREIKQLSDSTAASTRQIEALVRSILGEIEFARLEARTSGERAGGGLALANSASLALDAIYAQAELIRARVARISDATSSQTRETANLKQAVRRVADLAARLRQIATDRIASSQQVVGRVREISDLAYRVRAAMADQEGASLGIVTIIERLTNVAGALEAAVDRQSLATHELADAIAQLSEAGQTGQASVAAMAYAHGVLGRRVDALRDEISLVRLPSPTRGGAVVVPTSLSGAYFDPVRASTENHSTVLDGVFETLVASREEGNLAPCLAESWSVSGDGREWRFRLRPGVIFHHGRAMTADDVVFSFERLARLGDEGAFVLAPVRGVGAFRAGKAAAVAGIRAVSETEVAIELDDPVAFFPDLLALTFASVVPRDRVEADPEGFARFPVGTGPYRADYVGDDWVRLVRWERYRDPDLPHLDQIEFDLDVGPDEALDGVLEGRFAYTKYIPRERLPGLLADADQRSRVEPITQPHCHYLLLNGNEGRLSDARVRRAIAHAIDRNAVIEAYSTAPVAVRAEGLVPPTCPGYDASLRGPSFDPDLARLLLDEAGYDRSRPVRVALSSSPWGLGGTAAGRVAEMLDRVGLRVEARTVDDIAEARRGGDYDVVESAWYGDYLDPDTFTFGPFHSTLGTFHELGPRPELDALLERARATADPEARAALYREIHFAFQDVCPAVVLLHRRDYIVHSRRVEGVHLYPLLPTVRPRDLWIRETARDGGR